MKSLLPSLILIACVPLGHYVGNSYAEASRPIEERSELHEPNDRRPSSMPAEEKPARRPELAPKEDENIA